MCDILRKTVARKAWAIARVFPTLLDRDSECVNE